MYTQDGRSIVDTIGRRRFRVISRGMRDGYYTAKVVLIRDTPVEQHEFDGKYFQRHPFNSPMARTFFLCFL